jgi:hypothetical protein
MPRGARRAQAQLVRELGAIVRNQAPSGRASVLDAYGEVLLRGWRAAAGACLFEVEALIQARAGAGTTGDLPLAQGPWLMRVTGRGPAAEPQGLCLNAPEAWTSTSMPAKSAMLQ